MLLTNNEAKKVKCHAAPAVVVQAQMGMQIINPPCVGAACMAWRWSPETRTENNEERQRGFCGSVQQAPTQRDISPYDFGPDDRPKPQLIGV